MELEKILKKRRSIYDLGDKLPISQEEIITLVKNLTELVPDAFNMKSARVVILFDKKHQLLWDTIYDIFEGKVPKEKIESFSKGAGTILYFYDKNTIQALQENFLSMQIIFLFGLVKLMECYNLLSGVDLLKRV